MYRKGTVLIWSFSDQPSSANEGEPLGNPPGNMLSPNITSDRPHYGSEGNGGDAPQDTVSAALMASATTESDSRKKKRKLKRAIDSLHVDIIGNEFWTEHSDILQGE